MENHKWLAIIERGGRKVLGSISMDDQQKILESFSLYSLSLYGSRSGEGGRRRRRREKVVTEMGGMGEIISDVIYNALTRRHAII